MRVGWTADGTPPVAGVAGGGAGTYNARKTRRHLLTDGIRVRVRVRVRVSQPNPNPNPNPKPNPNPNKRSPSLKKRRGVTFAVRRRRLC